VQSVGSLQTPHVRSEDCVRPHGIRFARTVQDEERAAKDAARLFFFARHSGSSSGKARPRSVAISRADRNLGTRPNAPPYFYTFFRDSFRQ